MRRLNNDNSLLIFLTALFVGAAFVWAFLFLEIGRVVALISR